MYFAPKLTLICASLALSMTTALAASDAPDLTGYIGKTRQEISTTLKEKGYEVRKVDTEDGYLEAYALKDGERFEIYVDPATGEHIKTKRD